MSQVIEMKEELENMLLAFKERVRTVDDLFFEAPLLVEDFQESFYETREEEEKLSEGIRDLLAQSEHLRKKDFDLMMQRIVHEQEQRQRHVKELLHKYVNEQKEMAQQVHQRLNEYMQKLKNGEMGRLKRFQESFQEILARQTQRKEAVVSQLEKFQKEQQDLVSQLKELLQKGTALRIKDFKLMIGEIDQQQHQRKRQVGQMLQNFRKQSPRP